MTTLWTVNLSRAARKQFNKLNLDAVAALRLLVDDLIHYGPAPGKGWRNYSKLRAKKGEDLRHCHLTGKHPTYVCCWKVVNKKIKIIEIYYVSTHEKAPYQ